MEDLSTSDLAFNVWVGDHCLDISQLEEDRLRQVWNQAISNVLTIMRQGGLSSNLIKYYTEQLEQIR